MGRQALAVVVIAFCAQAKAFSLDPLDKRINGDKPVSPAAMPVDENGNFIPVAMKTDPIDQRLNREKPVSPAMAMPVDPDTGVFIPVTTQTGYETQRQSRFQTALKEQDPVKVMDEGTPDEIARAFGMPTEAEADLVEIQNPQSLRQDAVYGGEVAITVDIASQSLMAQYPGGSMSAAVSTARRGYYTKTGCFRRPSLELMHYSSKYENSPMPHSMFYYGGFAIHGTYEQSRLGRPASHGCVRVSLANATTLYSIVKTYGASNTTICVQ
jgi:lipoprotein-anchoring transpeptidase ErfK/SrfK